jgi:hypothetical protein
VSYSVVLPQVQVLLVEASVRELVFSDLRDADCEK